MDSPDWEDCTANLKISNESGFSGVAAVIPKIFPAGSETCNIVRIINFGTIWSCHIPCWSKSRACRPRSLQRQSSSA